MTNITLSIVPYEDCKEALISFRNTNRTDERNELYFDWRYLERPNSGQKPIIVWAETEYGEKIGSCSIIPHHFSIDNMVHLIGVLGDISVVKHWRGKGIAQRMFKYLSGSEAVRKFKFCFVLPNEAAARPLAKTGWQIISKIDRYVKVIDVKEKLTSYIKSSWLSSALSIPINFLFKIVSYEIFLKEADGFKAGLVQEFDDAFDDLWNRICKKDMILALRNRDYLTWRYLNQINKSQIFILKKKSKLCGYIIFSLQEKICLIDDILCLHDNRNSLYLLYYFLKYIRKNGTAASISLTLKRNSKFSLPLLKFGFIKRPDHQQIMVNICEARANNNFLLNGDNWFLTYGDKDVL